MAGTQFASGKAAWTVGNVPESFGHAQDTIIEVALSTAKMIGNAGTAVPQVRVDATLGLKFSASGGVIRTGVAGEASLKVSLGHDVTAKPPAAAAAVTARIPGEPCAELSAGSS